MMETPVTQSLYYAVMKKRPSHFKGDYLPVEKISFEESILFCNAISKAMGFEVCYPHFQVYLENVNGYRLPFNEEWEWAAQGGQRYKYAGSNCLDDVGWYIHNSNRHTHRVAEKDPNGYGLYDLSGNVGEWCIDIQDKSSAMGTGVVRGGSWFVGERKCQIDSIDRPQHTHRLNRVGLRLVQLLEQED